MNYGISILFRVVPLAVALFCFGYRALISVYGGDSDRLVAGPVAFSLGMICTALFATAATIIRQIVHTYGRGSLYALPIIGYLAATVTIVGGICMFIGSVSASSSVARYVVAGVGLMTTCVATATTPSTRFSLIPANSKMTSNGIPRGTFTKGRELVSKTIATIVSLIARIWAFVLLAKSDVHPAYFIAGYVVAGPVCICTSPIALIATIARRIRNVYTDKERKQWPKFVLLTGTISLLWRLSVIFADSSSANGVVGYIMIGLGLVRYSISSKVILSARTWGRESALASRISLIPVLTTLAYLFLASFVFELGMMHDDYFIPTCILAGLEAICLTLFSIVSIFESGASSE